MITTSYYKEKIIYKSVHNFPIILIICYFLYHTKMDLNNLYTCSPSKARKNNTFLKTTWCMACIINNSYIINFIHLKLHKVTSYHNQKKSK